MTVPYSHIALEEISRILPAVNRKLYGTVMGAEAATKDPVGTRTGRDERRAAILKIAHDAFLSEGYAATSMSAIAARVGGSKATLYNYFPSKEDLFRAVVQDRCELVTALLDQGRLEGGDFRTVLTKFGERFVTLILSEEFVRTYRMMMSEAMRFPEIGRAFYEAGPKQGAHRVGEYFATAIEAGELKRDDPDMMAQNFLDLCLSRLHFRRLWNVTPAPTAEDVRANVARAVSIFLAAFGR